MSISDSSRRPLGTFVKALLVVLAILGAIGLVWLSALLLLSDPSPDAEVQPLEIIAGNPDPDYGRCVLNVDEVGAGIHDVGPVSLDGDATVRILDPSGAVVFERVIESHPAKGGGHMIPPEDEGSVSLSAGDHRVQCILADGTHTTKLRVVPARPDNER